MLRALIARLLSEPVLLITLAIEGLTQARTAVETGLGPEDVITAGVIAVLGLLGRELVTPMRKVRSGEVELAPEFDTSTPGDPFIPDEQPLG